MDRGQGIASNSPTLAADPTNHLFVVLANRRDAPDFGCALQVSGDGGTTWTTANPVPVLPASAEKCYGPEVGFDRRGRLYYLFIGLAGTGNRPVGAFLTTSMDRGRTFAAPKEVLGPLNFGVRMAIDRDLGDNGRIHIVWLHASTDPGLGGFASVANPIMSVYSDDGGTTFSEPVQVSDARRQRVVAPALALGSGHRVAIGYYDLGTDAVDYQGLEGPVWGGNWSLIASVSTDGGKRFGQGRVVDHQIVPSQRVLLVFTMPPAALALDAKRLCAAWTDGRNGDDDVWSRCSSDAGVTWHSARRVNDDSVGNGHSQYLPQMTLSGGKPSVIFYDRRDDVRNLRAHVYLAEGTEVGKFGRNRRVTTYSSDVRLGQQYAVPSAKGLVDFGSRIALIAGPSRFLAAWADTRNSNAASTGQDVFAARVEMARPAPTALVGGGAGLVAIGLLTGMAAFRRRPPPPEPGRSAPSPLLLGASLLGASAVLLLTSCRSPRAASPPLPRPPPVVDVDMTEFSFRYQQAIPDGRVVFRIRNVGRIDHILTLTPLAEDIPPIDAQLRGSERRILPQFAGVPTIRPGARTTFAADLRSGQRYAFLCLTSAGTGRPHGLLGMSAEFRAGQNVPRGTGRS